MGGRHGSLEEEIGRETGNTVRRKCVGPTPRSGRGRDVLTGAPRTSTP